MHYSRLKREHCGRSTSPFTINVASDVLFPCYNYGSCSARVQAHDSARGSGCIQPIRCYEEVARPESRSAEARQELGVEARGSAGTTWRPDTAGLFAHCTGAQPADHLVHCVEVKWTEMNRNVSPWSHCDGVEMRSEIWQVTHEAEIERLVRRSLDIPRTLRSLTAQRAGSVLPQQGQQCLKSPSASLFLA